MASGRYSDARGICDRTLERNGGAGDREGSHRRTGEGREVFGCGAGDQKRKSNYVGSLRIGGPGKEDSEFAEHEVSNRLNEQNVYGGFDFAVGAGWENQVERTFRKIYNRLSE